LDPCDIDRMVSRIVVGMRPGNPLLDTILLFVAFRWFSVLPEADGRCRSADVSLL
jgi:hypothetical protein